MAVIEHHLVPTNGIRMHVAAAGPADGPAVVLCHGFPESWYSWRHQLHALADEGYRVYAPDQRGYGRTSSPWDPAQYTQLHLVGDLVGMLDAFRTDRAVVVGHDWGGPVAWHAAQLRPDRFHAVVGVSVHHSGGRSTVKPTDNLRAAMNGAFLYILHFQDPGVAEAELDHDIAGSMRRILYSLSGDIPRADFRFFNPDATCLDECLREPSAPMTWLTDDDLAVFAGEFERKGTFRYGINWYRAIDRTWELTAAFAGKRIEQPALFIGAEHDVILGQTEAAVLATREHVTALRDPIWIAGSGHWVQQERPDEFNEALLRFLGSL
jgi:pimeloyl-ACP methyl ester carboxylesterase